MFSISFTMNAGVRRRALEHWLATKYKGNRQQLIANSGVKEARISQLLTEGHSFGERAARRLEKALRLPLNALDQEYGPPAASPEPIPTYNTPEEPPVDLNKQAAELVNDWLTLDAIDRARVKADVAVAAMKVRTKIGESMVRDGTASIEKYSKAERTAKLKPGGTQ